jgi:signal transduction histidine kinase
MRSFRDLPIRRKLLIMTLVVSTAAVLVAEVGFVAYDIVRTHAEINRDMNAQARIVAENSAAPLAFSDDVAAGETLAVLELRPQVSMACLFTADDRLLATYHRDEGQQCPGAARSPSRSGWDELDAVVPVTLDGRQLGALYIQRDLSDLYQRLQVAVLSAIGLLIIAGAASFLIGARIERSVSSPLLRLADTARTISSTRDYSLRAAPGSADEIGELVTSFNHMLDRIAERERERLAALEREREANRLKDEFLATLSHELRTPLNAVLGWARLLRKTQVEPELQTRALEAIERNALTQTRLIEDLLDVSRIVTGKLRLHVEAVDLAAVVDAAIDVLQPAAAAKQLRVEVDIQARPAMTFGDADRLQQIIWNIASNAVKFTPAGGTIWVRLASRAGYALTVRDSGRGIDPRFVPHVFEPFSQADGTPTREHGGLGLGLAIAKQLVELHGGTISVQSGGQGHGSTFEVFLPSTIPVTAPASPPSTALTATHIASRAPGRLDGLRLLVVDDEADARLLLEAALTDLGAEVHMASSAAEALAAIERHTPDVVVSDIGMPGEDGYSLIRKIRERPSTSGGAVPAVALTAYASDRDRATAIAAGYQAHLAKPVDPAQLASVVAQLGGRTS